jgi:hypothetical protein
MRFFSVLFVLVFSVGAWGQIPVIKLEGQFGYDYQHAELYIFDNGSMARYDAEVKWRGGSTNLDDKHKRNYRIKLSKNVSLFGMREDEDWILDAGQADVFRLRNRIATELWNDFAAKPYYHHQEPLARSGVRGQVVEVYLNDEYEGIYSLTENMDRKQMRLMKCNSRSGEVFGALWKAKGWGVSTMWRVSPYDNKSELWDNVEAKYPDLSDLDLLDYSTLYNAIDFVANSSDEEFVNHVHEYFDMPVLIDYYILLYVLNAFDNMAKNLFWAVYDQTLDKKLTLAVWDLDSSVGQQWVEQFILGSSQPDYPMQMDLNLYVRLVKLNADDFNGKVVSRYYNLRKTYLSTSNLIDRYSSYGQLLQNSGAAKREEQRWSGDSDVGGRVIDFQAELDYITDWIKRHMEYLDKYVFVDADKVPTIVMDNDRQIYNLYGQRVDKNSVKRGIYIQGKRKFISR